jgi:protein ImuB
MKPRTVESQTADLFAAADASPAPAPAPTPAPSLEVYASPRAWQAGGVPPTPQTAGRAPAKQLWYAAVFPQLIGMEHSTAVLQRLCLHAQQFTSFVSIELPNALLLEIKGSLKLFGPLGRLHADIDARWSGLALAAQSATAPSTLAALWLARGTPWRAGIPVAGHPPVIEDLGALPGRLAKLPIACTAWEDDRLQTLRAMGVTRMGELLRLPRAGLARRLGTGAVQDLDIALARHPAPRRAFVPRERFRERCDFESEIETVAYLEKALEPLIARCAQFLRERQAGVQRLCLKLRHRAGPATCVQLGLASITSERRRLADVIAQKLGRLELTSPVRGMELICGSLQPLSAGSLDMFAGLTGTGPACGRDSAPQCGGRKPEPTPAGRPQGEGQDGPSQCGGRKPEPTPAGRPQGEGQDGPSQLVERLRARLGEEAVYGVVSLPEHRPEAAWRRVHELSLASTPRMEKMTDRSAGDGMPRPVWLLDTPLSLSEPDMQEGHGSGLVLEQGPERIESGWWDGKGVARDYYVARQCGGRMPMPTPVGTPAGREPRMGARQPQGAKLWVFQERQSKRWYLHGVFA